MFSTAKVTRTTTLFMEEEETKWLIEVMRNRLHDEESEEDTKMREIFYKALTKVDKLER